MAHATRSPSRRSRTSSAAYSPDPSLVDPHPRASRHSSRRPRPLPETIIDLTESSPLRPLRDAELSPLKKRLKTSANIEAVDLISDEDAEALDSLMLLNQRVTVAETGVEKCGRKKLAAYSCIICMEDQATDLTATPCGHLFCHFCLHGAIRCSATTPNKSAGKCPVCRGKINLKDLIPLEVKVLSKMEGKRKAQ